MGTFIDENTIISSSLCVHIDENSPDLKKLPKYVKQFEFSLETSKYFYTAYYGISGQSQNQAASILRGMPFKNIFIVKKRRLIQILILK